MKQQLLLITSPPASGKTYVVSKICNLFDRDSVLVISPLRALADECKGKWPEDVIVNTPEEWLGKKSFRKFVVFDEFHLFFYWGDTFRPLIWEVFYEISERAEMVLLLTATVSPEMRHELSFYYTQFDDLLWIDFGNRQLKNLPAHYFKAPSRQWVIDEIEHQKPGMNVKLIFCKYRAEVFEMERRLSKLGYSCITCVGGESKFMKEKLRMNNKPDYIISTTVLSHGVNLPDIEKIYFLYQVQNIDFWIQMVARGGRRGEKYEVFALEKPLNLKWNPLLNLILIIWLTFRRSFSLRPLRLY